MDLELLDFSFLTDEERESIIAVLDRDSAIREQDEKRVRHLRKQYEKTSQSFKFVLSSGDWFHSVRKKVGKASRHTSQVIRESLRRKNKSAGNGRKISQATTTKELAKDQNGRSKPTQPAAEESVRTTRPRAYSAVKEKSASLQEILAILSNTSPVQRRRSLSATGKQEILRVTDREKAIFDALSTKDDFPERSPTPFESAEPYFIIKDKISTDPSLVRDMVRKETVNTTGTRRPPKRRTAGDHRPYFTGFQQAS